MKKASNEYGLPMNIQFFAEGADANIDQTGENGAQGAQEAAGQAKTYTEEGNPVRDPSRRTAAPGASEARRGKAP